jgi:hypothetical protein
MKQSNINAINAEKNLEARLNQAVSIGDIKLPETIFSNFETILIDESNLINWNQEESHPCYEKYRLEGTSLIKLPPYQIPTVTALQDLKAYKAKLESTLIPLEQTKSRSNHLELFKQAVVLLINCYPTYCKKDDSFKEDTLLAFLAFFEAYPIAIITKEIHEWIKTKKQFPIISELRTRIEKKVSEVRKKLNRLDKIIIKSMEEEKSIKQKTQEKQNDDNQSQKFNHL